VAADLERAEGYIQKVFWFTKKNVIPPRA